MLSTNVVSRSEGHDIPLSLAFSLSPNAMGISSWLVQLDWKGAMVEERKDDIRAIDS